MQQRLQWLSEHIYHQYHDDLNAFCQENDLSEEQGLALIKAMSLWDGERVYQRQTYTTTAFMPTQRNRPRSLLSYIQRRFNGDLSAFATENALPLNTVKKWNLADSLYVQGDILTPLTLDQHCYAISLRSYLYAEYHGNQTALANALGITPQRLSRWLNHGAMWLHNQVYLRRTWSGLRNTPRCKTLAIKLTPSTFDTKDDVTLPLLPQSISLKEWYRYRYKKAYWLFDEIYTPAIIKPNKKNTR